MAQLILGSQSPRRKEILEFFEIPFEQIPADVQEESLLFTGDPALYARTLSEWKAEELAKKIPDKLILTADTVVYLNGKIYNKPRDEKEATSMLMDFSGQWQEVHTALTLRKGEWHRSLVEKTRLLFHPLSEKQIHLYHKQCSFLDKAGAYTIQKGGSILVARIEGCPYNVMGLPIHALKELLLEAGVDLWQHLKPV